MHAHFQRFILCLLAACAAVCHASPRAGELIALISGNPKLSRENSPLADFERGAETARVIVTLRAPLGSAESIDLSGDSAKMRAREAVQTAQSGVIASLNPERVRITNRFSYIYGFSAEVTLEGLRELISRGDVVSVENDGILTAHLAQGIPLMNASAARGTYNGAGVSIAICDTGIDYTHPRLGGGGFPNGKVIGGYDCGDEDGNPMDANGHGTCCAGIAAGDLGTTGDYIGGVAHNARLYAVKISYGNSGSAYTSDMIQGWEWCVTHQNDDAANPILVISTSFGGGREYSTCDSYSPAMTDAAANAVAAGITLFVSSGNNGYCDSIGWPGCISHVISVGAVYDAAFGTYYPCISSASCAPTKFSTGGCSTGYAAIDSTAADMVTSYSNSYARLGLLAPSNQAYTTDIVGTGGYSTGSYYASFGGTSAACPYAAGAAACLQSAAMDANGDFLTPTQVRFTLGYTGDAVTDGKVSVTTPRVNLGDAVDHLLDGSPMEARINFQPQSASPPQGKWMRDWATGNSGLPVFTFGWQ